MIEERQSHGERIGEARPLRGKADSFITLFSVGFFSSSLDTFFVSLNLFQVG